ncbi:MAG: Methionine--tRNA ligase [Elusimicrobia bacterium ADurb.Bin231]|nr:MAG: Methionine--tRNA ligase [Elusimicrobia bacterium ADurb.Bin231]
MKKFYITTPLYYVNDKPHLGHSYTTIAADVLARYYRARSGDAFLLTGTDEHGSKIEEASLKHGSTPVEWADSIVGNFKGLWKRLNISYDDFIRTTEPRHIKKVQEVFAKLLESGDIYKGRYSGWYCVSCEAFCADAQVIDGKCPDCARQVSLVEEESYFFKLSKYQDKIIEHYEKNPDFLKPSWRAAEMKNFVKSGLKDLSVSRTQVKWGIPVPGDEKHTIYVWFDALLNYLSASEGRDIWPCDIHFVGKEIFKFHTVIWPAILMALGVTLPKTVFAHGWWTVNGEKMSKSKGNFVDPNVFIDKYGCDAYRYFVLRQIPFGQDGDFSESCLLERYNSDLANNLGNLVSRTLSMMSKYGLKNLRASSGSGTPIGAAVSAFAPKFYLAMENAEFGAALSHIWEIINITNKTIDSEKPWALAKSDPKKLEQVMSDILSALVLIADNLRFFMPETSDRIKKILECGEVSEPLFPRLQ